MGVGLIVGAATVNRFGRDRSKKSIVLSGLGACAAGIALLGIFRAVSAAVATTFTMGFGISFVVVAAQTLMQQETPPELMGRVGSTFMSCVLTAQILGLLLSGVLTEFISVRNVFAICAAMLLLLALAGRLFMEPGRFRAKQGPG